MTVYLHSKEMRKKMEKSLHSLEEFKSDLISLGVRPGDTLLMHSSYKSLGGIQDGAAGIFKVLTDLLGDEGTLILPALSYASVTADNPVYVHEETPCCIGYLPEYFRTQVPGVIRSIHPTHSCCLKGKRAEEMAKDHELDLTPAGPNSPFAKLPKVDGKILLLGSHTNSNTIMHGVEETAEPPYLFDRSKRIEYILRVGDKEIKQRALRHYFTRTDVAYVQCYSRVLSLLTGDEIVHGKVLDADCWLLSAKAVWEKGHAKLKEDPFYFVDKIELENER